VVFSSAILRLPGAGFNLLMTEFGDVDRSRREANPRNPGASTFVLIVKDLDRPFHTLKREGARVVTRGGVPVDLPDHSRSVVVRDADGFLVQLLQPGHLPATELPESGNVLSAHVRLTVHRLDDAIAFYRGVLGFDLSSPSTRLSDPDTQKLIDVHGAQWRISTGGLPGTGQSFEFVEYENGGEASPFKQLRDPGTPAFSMSVRSVDALLTAVRASGAPVVSVGKEPVVSPNGGRNIFIRDADGFFLELEGPSGR
jgi:catechol 2,3-dioxygenase-like lactoylglutathione lyase family enzyme